MPVLSQIIEWSRERPLWQQDALRRLVEQPKLEAGDIDALVALCRAEAGLATEGGPTARGLSEAIVQSSGGGPPAVRLTGVYTVRNVNALRDDQALAIAPTGLTVVYGDNGAGKSGYVRVLKQVCRARGGRDAVHPNVYDEEAGTASAAVCYEVGPPSHESANGGDPKDDDARRPAESVTTVGEVLWTPDVGGPVELAQVSVFDSRSASVYVTEENAVAYLPHGTDLFPRLVSVVEKVRSALEQEIGELDRAADRFESIPTGTTVHDVLSNLHVEWARARVDELADVTDGGLARLEELRAEDRRLQTNDPAAKAKDLRRCAQRLEQAHGRLAELKAALNESGIAGLKAAREALDSASAAAELASGRAFSDAPIGGVGIGGVESTLGGGTEVRPPRSSATTGISGRLSG